MRYWLDATHFPFQEASLPLNMGNVGSSAAFHMVCADPDAVQKYFSQACWFFLRTRLLGVAAWPELSTVTVSPVPPCDTAGCLNNLLQSFCRWELGS